MSREILYKAKGIEGETKEQWVEGFYREHKLQDRLTNSFYKDKGINYFIDSNINNESYFIDPATVCEYTGLTDKNGNKIFEGDIFVAGYYKWKCKVVWDNECARFIGLTNDKEIRIVYVDMVDKHDKSAVEVIGNIFDNPELLKSEDD